MEASPFLANASNSLVPTPQALPFDDATAPAQKRIFVALPVPQAVQDAIFATLEGWGGLQEDFVAFNKGDLMHATMVPPRNRCPIEASNRLRKCVALGVAIPVRLKGFSFRLANKTSGHSTLRVLMEPHQGLSALSARLNKGLGSNRRSFSGHITLARLGTECPKTWIDGFMQRFGTLSLSHIQWTVNEVALFDSDSKRERCCSIVSTASLGGCAGAPVVSDSDPDGSWNCPYCGNTNWPKRTHCNNKRCRRPKVEKDPKWHARRRRLVSREAALREKTRKHQRRKRTRARRWKPHAKTTTASGTAKTQDAERTVFVGRLSFGADETALQTFFAPFGEVVCVSVAHHPKTGVACGYAFVEFATKDGAQRAYDGADGRPLLGRLVLVDRERGRTQADWKPRFLGGGLGSTRAGGVRKGVNDHHAGRDGSHLKRMDQFVFKRKGVAALRRIRRELARVSRARHLRGVAVIANPVNMREWRITVGHPGAPQGRAAAAFVLLFPDSYPFESPRLFAHPATARVAVPAEQPPLVWDNDPNGPAPIQTDVVGPLARHPSMFVHDDPDPGVQPRAGLCLALLDVEWGPATQALEIVEQLVQVFDVTPELQPDSLQPVPTDWPVPSSVSCLPDFTVPGSVVVLCDADMYLKVPAPAHVFGRVAPPAKRKRATRCQRRTKNARRMKRRKGKLVYDYTQGDPERLAHQAEDELWDVEPEEILAQAPLLPTSKPRLHIGRSGVFTGTPQATGQSTLCRLLVRPDFGNAVGEFLDPASLVRLCSSSRQTFAVGESDYVWQQLYLRMAVQHSVNSPRHISQLVYPAGGHARRPGFKWRRVLEHHLHRTDCDVRCTISREPHTQRCLGLVLHFSRKANNSTIDHVVSDFEVLSHEEFVHTDYAQKQYEGMAWMPLYLTADHWKRAHPLFRKAVVEMCDGASKAHSHSKAKAAHLGGVYSARAAVTLLLRMMNTFCVLICDSGHANTDVVFNGFCGLYRVLLAVMEENTALADSYRRRIQRFLQDEQYRHKKHWANMGEFNLLAPLFVDHFPWTQTLLTKQQESAARRCLWIGKRFPSTIRALQAQGFLGHRVSPGLLVCHYMQGRDAAAGVGVSDTAARLPGKRPAAHELVALLWSALPYGHSLIQTARDVFDRIEPVELVNSLLKCYLAATGSTNLRAMVEPVNRKAFPAGGLVPSPGVTRGVQTPPDSPVLLLAEPDHFGLLLAEKIHGAELAVQTEVIEAVVSFAHWHGFPAFDDIGTTFLDVALESLFRNGVVSQPAFVACLAQRAGRSQSEASVVVSSTAETCSQDENTSSDTAPATSDESPTVGCRSQSGAEDTDGQPGLSVLHRIARAPAPVPTRAFSVEVMEGMMLESSGAVDDEEHDAELTEVEETQVSDCFRGAVISKRMKMFQCLFRKSVLMSLARYSSPRGGPETLVRRMANGIDYWAGRLPEGVLAELRQGMPQILAVTSFREYYRIVGVPIPSPREQLARLSNGVAQSLRQGYHQVDQDFSRVHAMGVSNILLRGRSYPRVAYVIDTSGSMDSPLPGTDVSQMGFVKAELEDILLRTAAQQQFNIIAFNDDVWVWSPMDSAGRGLVQATPANIDRAIEFAQSLEAGGLTNMCEALEMAFAIPGIRAVFLLSDGEPNGPTYTGIANTLDRVRDWSTRPDGSQIVCHTTALCTTEHQECTALMRGIAEVTGGEMMLVNQFDAAVPDEEVVLAAQPAGPTL